MKLPESVLNRAVSAYAQATRAPFPSRSSHLQYAATVTAVTWLLPGLRRVTLSAPELAGFELCGPDEYVGLIMPPADRALTLPDPTRANVRAAVAALPDEVRPDLRWYTIAHHRPERAEVDIDIVDHGDSGPGSAWSARVRPRDAVGVRSGGACYVPPPLGTTHLLVADETALPALGAILRQARGRGVPADELDAHIEVGDADWGRAWADIEAVSPVTIHTRAGRPGAVVREALTRRFETEPLPGYAWVCGEAGLSTDVRRALIRAGMERRSILFSTYWKVGAARP